MDVTLSRSCCGVPWPGLCARHKEGSTRRPGRETGVESSELRVHLGPHRLRGACWASPLTARSLSAGRGHCPLALLVSHKAWPMEGPHVWGPHKGKLPWQCPHDAHNSRGEVTEGRGAGWSAPGWRRGRHRPGATRVLGALAWVVLGGACSQQRGGKELGRPRHTAGPDPAARCLCGKAPACLPNLRERRAPLLQDLFFHQIDIRVTSHRALRRQQNKDANKPPDPSPGASRHPRHARGFEF